ncbi:hypothetical protein PF005_g2325 [Phytophthora fragariae]|uniref:Uncharacterized protein n=1 Tax=Phytophthora fragariae TaxID=53985 RepID=A0A6A3FQF1_9STRA|nr:hypothetical protein PF009_g2534 [Phytophthora fragariae]KAE9135837.1 hypothetical protein PF007_g2411 [Phytophthora fragariae]KAE9154010.1 hypothetical protein PF006_g1912 [Phytophthora fragariae]KAE9233432.1 hypothetical protein PF005_g2325 [Phytophthora fragariae]
MRLSKHNRSKKGRVAPMSDDDGDNNDNESTYQSNSHQPRQESRGVSFSTPRGKIWLILVINLCIVTAFIFMSSSRIPSLSGDSVLSDALEQDPVPKNVDETHALSATHSEEEQLLNDRDATEVETEKPSPVIPNEDTGTDADTQGELPRDRESEKEVENSFPSVTQETASDIDPASAPPTTSGDTSAKADTKAPRPGQRSQAEIAGLISHMKETQSPSLETLAPEQRVESNQSSATSTSAPETSTEVQPAAVESKAFLDNLVTWVTGDSGVEVENLAVCLASSGDDLIACGVNRWINQMASSDPNAADATAFRAASPQQKPVWVPVVPDTHNQLPAVYFSCPMISDALRMHESMTLFFVLSPAQIERGDSYAGQKFFGNSPYGQFALHGGKPSFLANMGLVESEHMVPMGQFSLVTYRLNPGYAEIKANGGAWGGESPAEGDAGDRRLRITVNDVVSLGNSKSDCDTNAFQGRIAEMLVYDAVLDDTKVEAVEKYLYDKWWGDKPFPETAPPAAKTSEPESAPPAVDDPVEELPTDAPAAADTDGTLQAEDNPATPEVELHQATEEPQQTKELLQVEPANAATQDPTPADESDVTPAPKFDPLVNIFEWTAPGGSDTAKVQQWTRTVKEKVDYIRNFQLGGAVLRELIRQHKDELVELREQLFG